VKTGLAPKTLLVRIIGPQCLSPSSRRLKSALGLWLPHCRKLGVEVQEDSGRLRVTGFAVTVVQEDWRGFVEELTSDLTLAG
jgi:hypothetical protein